MKYFRSHVLPVLKEIIVISNVKNISFLYTFKLPLEGEAHTSLCGVFSYLSNPM